MSLTLLAAATYNVAWGLAVGLFPVHTMRWIGVATESRDLWPSLWACIGMIVGVYGVGYAIAARDPIRHWPIVLVGLLGKILGPIGFLGAALRGDLPWTMGFTILTNDLAWWIPFAAILWHAARSASPSPRDTVPLDQALDSLTNDQGRTLRSLTDERPTLVVLLRHAGCTFCREAISDLARRQDLIRRAGMNLAVVGMSSTATPLRALGQRYALSSAGWFADHSRLLYRALELPRGTFLQLFGPSVWWRGLMALLRGHGLGALDGDGFQMPGAFVIHRGRVVRAYRHATAADRPDLAEFACPIT